MELDYKMLGIRIKKARNKKGLTQEKLSEIVDITSTHLSNIENNLTKVSLNVLVNLANALDVSVDELLCDSIAKSQSIFKGRVYTNLDECSDLELKIISDEVEALKVILRNRLK